MRISLSLFPDLKKIFLITLDIIYIYIYILASEKTIHLKSSANLGLTLMNKLNIAVKYYTLKKSDANLTISFLKYLAYYIIAFILLVSGIIKIISPENFLNTLNTTLNFLSESIIILIAAALPVIEIALGLMLVLRTKVKETLAAAVILFSIFLLFSIYGTIAGFGVDCGCFGTVIKNEFGILMIGRNFVLLLISLLLYKKEKMVFIIDQNK